jgi:phosphonate transport system substrate-binding protein
MTARNVIRKNQFVSLYKSQTFPTTGYGYVYNLHPKLVEKVKEAFFTFQWEGSDLLKEFGTAEPPQQKFIPITYKEHWQIVRDVDAAMGVKYDCKG